MTEELLPSTPVESTHCIDQTGWDEFTHDLLSRPLFQTYSKFRVSLRVLLDFLKAENSFYTDPMITPNPITNMCIESEMVHYRYGKGCMKKLDLYWNSESFDDIDTIGYYGVDSKPFTFIIKSKSSSNVLRGIVYTKAEYLRHQYGIQTKCLDRYPGSFFNDDACEEFHTFYHMGYRYIIVFLTKNGELIPRCSTPLSISVSVSVSRDEAQKSFDDTFHRKQPDTCTQVILPSSQKQDTKKKKHNKWTDVFIREKYNCKRTAVVN